MECDDIIDRWHWIAAPCLDDAKTLTRWYHDARAFVATVKREEPEWDVVRHLETSTCFWIIFTHRRHAQRVEVRYTIDARGQWLWQVTEPAPADQPGPPVWSTIRWASGPRVTIPVYRRVGTDTDASG